MLLAGQTALHRRLRAEQPLVYAYTEIRNANRNARGSLMLAKRTHVCMVGAF